MPRGRELETVVRISGDIDQSLQRVVDQAAQQIEELNEVARKAMGAYDDLNDEIRNQSKALKEAQKQYANYVVKGEQSSEAAEDLADEIKRLSSELKKNKSTLSAAERAAKELADSADDAEESVDDLADAAKDSKKGFTIMRGAISGVIANGLTGFISMCGDAARGVLGLADSTREYREDIGKLETAWEAAGKSTEMATETYKSFYSFIGEEDRSVEAVNHLAKFVDTEEDMATWTDIATGVWGTFGDSLPIEGLTEAANETVKTGTVTGVLADALNWAGISEEEFQKRLDACNSEQERADLITNTLIGSYGEAAEIYKENNESIIEARYAASDFTDAMAEMGERIEPITTAVTAGIANVLHAILALTEDVDIAGMADKISAAFQGFIEDILPAIENGLGWIIDHKAPIIAALTGIGAAFAVFAIAPVIASVVAALGGLVTMIRTVGIAQAALNVIMSMNPFGLVAAAIGALVAVGVLLYQNWDTIIATANRLWATFSENFPAISAVISAWWSNISAAFNDVKAIFTNIIDFIKNIFTGNWQAAWQNVANIFGNAFGAIVNFAKAPINAVVTAINGLLSGINKINIDIPDWVPGFGGQSFGFDIPLLPTFAQGGFTDGVSIAGEAGTEAVISFDRSVREANIGYWAKAGRLLGATAEDADLPLSGSSGGGNTTIDMGGVTFAPNITFGGKADKDSVVKAIRDEYPEFLDMLEDWLVERGLRVYA